MLSALDSNATNRFNEEWDSETTGNRLKRLVNLGLNLNVGKINLNVTLNLLDFWSNKRLVEATDHLPKPPRDYFKRGGVQTVTDARLFANFGVEPANMNFVDLTVEPWRHFGKIFYKTPHSAGCCSAVFVHSRILLTAAHCVKQPSVWYRNFLFFHRYNTVVDKGRPIRIMNIFVPQQYDRDFGVGYGDLRFDYAFLITEFPSDYGFLPVAFGIFPPAIMSGGYPKNAYCGEKLVGTEGRKGLEDQSFLHSPSNPMQEGCSGGPWFTRDSNGNFLVFGVNSHHRVGIAGLFSPKFDGVTASVYHTAIFSVAQQDSQSRKLPNNSVF